MVESNVKDNLREALLFLQFKTIGLFKNNYSPDSPLELVLEEDEGYLNTIVLNPLGGYIDNHIPTEKGKFVKFPDGKSLLEMKKEPFVLQRFIEENFNKG